MLSVRRQVLRQERNPQVVVITEHSLLDHPELQANTRVQVANLSDALRVYVINEKKQRRGKIKITANNSNTSNSQAGRLLMTHRASSGFRRKLQAVG